MSDEIKHKQSASQVRAPEGTKPPQPKVTSPSDTSWHPMTQAPQDGSYLYFKNDPFKEEWYWYRTRQFREGIWRVGGWWRRRLGPPAPASFVPEGFRRVNEGLPPPEKAA